MARTGAHKEPKEWSGEIRLPEIGHNYGSLFQRFGPETGNQMIYMGGITFKAVLKDGREMTAESQKQYDAVIDTINKVEISMGRP